MALKDLEITTSYESSESKTQLMDEFYNPVLEQAQRYYRIAGFFSSTALAVAAKGIAGLVKNEGRMYLLISPELSEEDYQTIQKHGCVTESTQMCKTFAINEMPNEHLQVLAWLLDAGRLEIKIVVGKKARNSLFHQKVGVIMDSAGDMISFSGSINETAQAWLNNIEEFKVFKSWEPGQMDYLQSDLNKFIAYWKNQRPDVADVYDIPDSIRAKIVKIKPRNVWDLNIMRRYKKDEKTKNNKLSLFPHQQMAVDAWLANGCSLLMEMATGTGKTRTAIGCLMKKLRNGEKLLTIVATPQNTLSRQWQKDFKQLEIALDHEAIIDGSNSRWKKDLELMLLDMSDEKIKTAIVFTTHATASSDDFIRIIRDTKFDTKILFIGDEVHAAGSAKQRKALLPEYEYRVGLSATPERMFDGWGTSLIREYFGCNSFEFTIADALATINPRTGKPFLNSFLYYPVFVRLTDQESRRYAKITQQILITKNQEDYDPDALQKLYERRADIGKNAENKLGAFKDLLRSMGPEKIQDTIAFVSDKQIVSVFEILSSLKIKRAKITESESAARVVTDDGATERQEIIAQFVRQQLQVLVGIKCLDEGIDIPNARVAILLSNSTNPREYVQRVGRVIRQAPDKEVSVIYDFIVLPSTPGGNPGLLEKEGRRAAQIARNAINYSEVREAFLQNGVDIDAD